MGKSSPDVERAIREMVRRIVRQLEPERIILFGSRARGEAGPDSDVDLLALAEARRAVALARRVRKHVRSLLPKGSLRPGKL